MTELNGSSSEKKLVSIGIDAAIVAAHQVAIRGEGVTVDFRVPPTLAGMRMLTERLAPYAGSLVVAEPTGGTWLPLSVAVNEAGCRIGFVANRESARLRKAIAGANKTDAIDAAMLANCEEILGVVEAPAVSFGQIGLRGVASPPSRRGERPSRRVSPVGARGVGVPRCVAGVRRASCRPAGVAPLGPSGPAVSRPCRLDSRHRGCSQPRQAPRSACRAYPRGGGRVASVLGGPIDVDALAWEVLELLDDVDDADVTIERASQHANVLWQEYWPDDVLCSIPGIGPICAASTRAWWGTAGHIASSKAAAAFVGLNPSNWESGLSASPSRPITKQGPADLRLAYYHAANVARRHDPELADFYRRLMVERRHNHIKANTAVARKLACRAWAVLKTGQRYQLRDLDGNKIDQPSVTAIAATLAVPDDVRRRSRTVNQRGRLSH